MGLEINNYIILSSSNTLFCLSNIPLDTTGGSSTEFFRLLQKPARFSGGGVVAEFLSAFSETRPHSVGGGGE